jgi:hypothetical protein
MDSVSVPFGISAPTSPIVPSISLNRRPLEHMPIDSESSVLDLTLAPTSPTRSLEVSPQSLSAQWLLYLVPQSLEVQDCLLVYEVSSTLVHHLNFISLPSPLLSSLQSPLLDPPFVFITTAVQFSSLVVSKTVSTLTCKSWVKNEDINSHRNSTTMQGNTFDLAQ